MTGRNSTRISCIFICMVLALSLSSCFSDNEVPLPENTDVPVQDGSKDSEDDVHQTDQSSDAIQLTNEMQEELIANLMYIGKTESELEAILGNLVYASEGEGASGYTAQQLTPGLELLMYYDDKNKYHCVGLAGPLSSLLPSLKETITLEQFNKMLGASAEGYDSIEFEGEHGVAGAIGFVPEYMLTRFGEEINKAVWEGTKVKIFIFPLENDDEIKPDSHFELSLGSGDEPF